MGNRWVAVLDRWLDYGILETILLYWLGWDLCILAVIGRWLFCSGGCSLRFHCIASMHFTKDIDRRCPLIVLKGIIIKQLTKDYSSLGEGRGL